MNTFEKRYFKLLTLGWAIVSKVPRDRVERLNEQPASLANTIEKRWKLDPSTKYVSTDIALSIFSNEIRKSKYARYFFPGVVNLYGSTKNNIREFEFFENLFPNLKTVNIASYRHFILSESKHETIPFKVVDDSFCAYLEGSQKISALELNTIIQFTSAFNSWVFANTFRAVSNIPIAIVANDHAPFQVAFSQAARFFKINTLYIQHAEVTDHFPPLHFNYAILRNDKSRIVYNTLGGWGTETFVIPRELGNFEHDRLQADIANPVCCLYLTANYLISEVKRFCLKLKANPFFCNLIIKVHPRTNLQDIERLSSELGIDVFATLHERPDIAISQNSAVITELLHQGIPTYYLGGTDWLPFDYYGYVEDRIVETIKLGDADQKFWDISFFDDDWRKRFERWNPKAGNDYKRDYAKLTLFVSKLTTNRISATKAQSLYSWFRACEDSAVSSRVLSQVLKIGAAPLHYFSHGFSANVSDDEAMSLVACIDKLHALRLPQVIKIYRASLNSKSGSVLELILKIKASEWLYEDLPDEFYEGLHERLHVFKKNRKLIGFFENSLFNYYIAAGKIEKCLRLIESAKVISLEKLHLHKKIALINKVFNQGVEQDNQQLIEKVQKSCNFYQLFKLKALTPVGSFENKHMSTIEELRNCIADTLLDEFEMKVLRVYLSREKQLRFMDVRWNSSQTSALFEMIQNAIETKSPFSMVRISEGEGYLFSETEHFMTAEDLDNRERHWWGEELDGGTRKKLLNYNKESLSNANIIGIPSIYRFIRDTREGAQSLTENLIQRGLLNALNGVNNSVGSHCQFTEEKANIPLFLNFNNMKRLFESADSVVFISSMNKNVLSSILDIPFRLINIPTHNRTVSNRKYSSFNKALPYVLEEKLIELEALVEPGTLVLVSAGVAGKCFLSVAKSKGAVALDIGGAIDFWFRKIKSAY